MNKINLEYYLSKGNSFGFNTKDDTLYIGWILLSKRVPISKFFERFTKSDNPILFKEQLDIINNPYLVHMAELKREIYEGDRFPSNKDFLINQNYKFSNLEDVESFLSSINLELDKIKWSSDILFI